ncbi:unnamed protein product, partial [Chrysoparadoxa australica]
LPDPSTWPDRPLFVRLSPRVPSQHRMDGEALYSPIPINKEGHTVAFETPLFKGRMQVRVDGMKNSSEAYFSGKKRLMQCAVQGQFKKEMPFSDLYTGQSYQKPFQNIPAKWLIRSAFAVIRRLSPALKEDITAGDMPFMISPLAATAQALRAEELGEELDISDSPHGLAEENRLLGGTFYDGNISSSVRKKHFSDLGNLKNYTFRTDLVYTFDFYQHLYNAVTFEIDLGFKKVQLADYLGGQPAQIMAQSLSTGDFLWNFELWNERLLPNGAS